MNTVARRLVLSAFLGLALLYAGVTRADNDLRFEPANNFPKLPPDFVLGRCSAVAVNSKGEIYLFHRGKNPLLCVDSTGKLLRSWDDYLIGTAHGLRIDRQDNIWVTDIGRHRVMKLDPTGKLLLALGTGKASCYF